MTLVMYPEEDDWMMKLGHLQERCPEQASCKLVVGPMVGDAALAENIKLLFIFQRLRHLELCFSDEARSYGQGCVVSRPQLPPRPSPSPSPPPSSLPRQPR